MQTTIKYKRVNSKANLILEFRGQVLFVEFQTSDTELIRSASKLIPDQISPPVELWSSAHRCS